MGRYAETLKFLLKVNRTKVRYPNQEYLLKSSNSVLNYLNSLENEVGKHPEKFKDLFNRIKDNPRHCFFILTTYPGDRISKNSTLIEGLSKDLNLSIRYCELTKSKLPRCEEEFLKDRVLRNRYMEVLKSIKHEQEENTLRR